jgi:hypothetical protein
MWLLSVAVCGLAENSRLSDILRVALVLSSGAKCADMLEIIIELYVNALGPKAHFDKATVCRQARAHGKFEKPANQHPSAAVHLN